MQANVTVKDRSEKKAVETAMEDPTIKACVVVTGTLMQLSSRDQQDRVLRFAMDKVSEGDEQQQLREARA
jgi:hypothetical protein